MDMFVRDIDHLNEGESFKGYFILEQVELKKHKTGQNYLRLILSDRTGAIPALFWKPPKEQDLMVFKRGMPVFAAGHFETFQEKPQPKLTDLRLAREGEYNPEKFLVKSKYDINKQYESLLGKIDSISNPYLKKLLEYFFLDDDFVKKFLKAPGGKIIHHACIGGLIEHTLGVCEICETVSKRYRNINRNLLIAAALLHDIGKVREYSVGISIERTDEGILLGHLYMGAEMISKAIDRIEGFPDSLRVKLLHCILSHHGEYEHGSPKKPKTLEAVVLANADALDSKVKGFEEQIQRELKDQKGWTKRHFAFGVPIYFDREDLSEV